MRLASKWPAILELPAVAVLINNKDILFHKNSDMVEWTRLYLYYMCTEWVVTIVTCVSYTILDSVGGVQQSQ